MSFLTPAAPSHRGRRQTAIASRHDHLPGSPDDHVDAILDVISRADGRTIAAGVSWYQEAHERARELAGAYGVSVESAAGIIAALSPQTSWALNLQLAGDYLASYRDARTDLFTGHTGDAIGKAWKIASGQRPFAILGGRKVRSFYANISAPDRPGPVTCDRHALAVLLRRPTTFRDRQLERPGVYQQCAAAYRSAARLLSLHPHETQAIAWCQWRHENAPAFASADPVTGSTPF